MHICRSFHIFSLLHDQSQAVDFVPILNRIFENALCTKFRSAHWSRAIIKHHKSTGRDKFSVWSERQFQRVSCEHEKVESPRRRDRQQLPVSPSGTFYLTVNERQAKTRRVPETTCFPADGDGSKNQPFMLSRHSLIGLLMFLDYSALFYLVLFLCLSIKNALAPSRVNK